MAFTGTVLVTGANSGIGLATTLELARRGFDVVGTVRSEAKADVLTRTARRAGVRVRSTLLDVTHPQSCAEVVDEVGPLRGLVNNAGYGITGAIEDIGDDEARLAIETMMIAPIRLARLTVPAMREQGFGRIVNLSSIYGVSTSAMTGWYQAAKHGLEALSDALRMEVAADGIQVVLIEPGGFKTRIWEDLDRDLEKRAGSRHTAAYERTARLMHRQAPLMGEPADCARVIAQALTSSRPRARYLVGHDAKLLAATTQWMPTGIRDRLVRTAMGL